MAHRALHDVVARRLGEVGLGLDADVRVVVPGDVWDSAWHAGWHAGSGMLPNQRRVRLAGSVVKLLEEVVSDNGAANELLMADVHIDPAMKGFFSYASAEEDDRVGRTSYINLFKACVEDEEGA